MSTAIIEEWGNSLGQIFGQDVSDSIDVISGLTEGWLISVWVSGNRIRRCCRWYFKYIKGYCGIYTTLTSGAKISRSAEGMTSELIRFQIEYNRALNDQIRTQMQSNVFIKDYVKDIQSAFTAIGDAQKLDKLRVENRLINSSMISM